MIKKTSIEIIPAIRPVEPFCLNCFVGDSIGAIAHVSGAVLYVNGRIHEGDFGLNDKELWKKIVSEAVGNRMIATLVL